MGNTTFEVTYYSLYAFVLALRAHECAISNPALASVEMGQGAGGKPTLVVQPTGSDKLVSVPIDQLTAVGGYASTGGTTSGTTAGTTTGTTTA